MPFFFFFFSSSNQDGGLVPRSRSQLRAFRERVGRVQTEKANGERQSKPIRHDAAQLCS